MLLNDTHLSKKCADLVKCDLSAASLEKNNFLLQGNEKIQLSVVLCDVFLSTHLHTVLKMKISFSLTVFSFSIEINFDFRNLFTFAD